MAKTLSGYRSPRESHRDPCLVLLCLCHSSMICLVLCLTVAHWHCLPMIGDAKCFRTVRSASDCVLFQGDIDNLVEWSDVWKMAFNLDKCSLCTITRKRNPIFHYYNMRGRALKRVEAQRDLGVLITCDARFNEHIYAQVNKANKMLGFIRRSLSSRSDQFFPTFRSL